MKDTVLLVVHNTGSRPGQVAAALEAKGWRTRRCCPKVGDALPEDPEELAGTVIFGGPMSANDDHLPFIRDELDWIPSVLKAGTPFLGICLGGQMLARCLGAAVAPHPDGKFEIGYYPIERTPAGDELFADSMHVYHWHGEGFGLANGCELLASGEIFPNQAYRYDGAVYGIQFHPEIQENILRWWMQEAAAKLSRPGARPPESQVPDHLRHGATMHRWLDDFIDTWLGPPG